MKKDRIILTLCAFIFISFSVGLYFVAANNSSAHLDLDSSGTDHIALHFAQYNQLINPQFGYVIPVQTLGYPLFVGLIYKVFGHQYIWVIIIQVLLSLLAGFLIFRIANELFGPSVALVSAGLFSINLGFLVYSQFLLSEILLATLLLAGLERFVVFFKNAQLTVLAQSGFLFGLSVAVKPVALFYLLILLLFLIIHFCNFKYVILFCSCFFLPVFGYMAHNKIMFDVFTISPVMNENIYYYFLAKLITQQEQIPYENALQKMDMILEGKNHNNEDRWNEPKKMFYQFVLKRPLKVLSLWFFNVSKTVGGLYSSQMKSLVNPELKETKTSFFEKKGNYYQRIYAYLTAGVNNRFIFVINFWQLIWMILQFILISISFITLIKKREYLLLSFFLATIAYFSFITGHDGCARYRMMFEGLYIILTAYGLVITWEWLKNRKNISKSILVGCRG